MFDVEIASLGELRDYHAAILEKREQIRDAEDEVSSTQSERLEAKHKQDGLEKEIWELIDSSDPIDDKKIKKTRVAHRKAVDDFSKKDSAWSKAKNTRDVLHAELLEVIDAKDDPQKRMDFDAAQEARDKSAEAKRVAKTMAESDSADESWESGDQVGDVATDSKAGRPDPMAEFTWQAMPISNLKLSKSISDSLSEANISTLHGLDQLLSGEHPEHPSGPLSIAGWGKSRVDAVTEKFHDYLKSRGVALVASDSVEDGGDDSDQDQYEDVPDDEAVGVDS